MRLLDNQVFNTHYFKPTYDFSVVLISSGWGRLAFYDPDEHMIRDRQITVARISKMASEWKIIHDFKPTASVFPLIRFSVNVSSSTSKIALYIAYTGIGVESVASDYVLTLNKWNRIEITYEEEEGGKYFLSFSVNGRNPNKKEVGDTLVMGSLKEDFNGIEIVSGHCFWHDESDSSLMMSLDTSQGS